MCLICETSDYSTLSDVIELDCDGCRDVTKIPDEMINLKKLLCSNTYINYISPCCINLEYIESRCTHLKFIPDTLVNLTRLDCNRNYELESIPDTLTKLEKLNCSGCEIKTIPNTLINLTRIICIECKYLKSIPDTFVNLIDLNCNLCPLIKNIPSTLIKLKYLECHDCLMLSTIPGSLDKLEYLGIVGCFIYLPFKIKKLVSIGIINNRQYINNNQLGLCRIKLRNKLKRAKSRIILKKQIINYMDEQDLLLYDLNKIMIEYL
jgi:hypothetical protein